MYEDRMWCQRTSVESLVPGWVILDHSSNLLETHFPLCIMDIKMFVLVAKLCPTLVTPWTVAHHASLYMGFSRQEYWNGLPCPFSRGSFQSRDQTCVSCIAGRLFTVWLTRCTPCREPIDFQTNPQILFSLISLKLIITFVSWTKANIKATAS